MTVCTRLSSLAPFVVLALTASAAAQEARAPAIYDTTGTAWVYASYYRIPWPRVDSLIKLQSLRPAWRTRAIEMGCVADWTFLIHQTGNEYNVVFSTTHRSFRSLEPGGESATCRDRAWRAVVPDSATRAAIAQGMSWVYGDAPHYDVIYWVPYPARR